MENRIVPYQIYPGPAACILTKISPFCSYDECDYDQAKDTSPEYSKDRFASALHSANLESPYCRVEHSIRQYAEDGPVGSEEEVVESHCWLRRVRMTICVLIADAGRVEKCCRRYCVCDKTEHVANGKVDCEAHCRLSLPVHYWLRIEGPAPGKEVQPSQHSRDRFGEVDGVIVRHFFKGSFLSN